jgi:hypothetical protein
MLGTLNKCATRLLPLHHDVLLMILFLNPIPYRLPFHQEDEDVAEDYRLLSHHHRRHQVSRH